MKPKSIVQNNTQPANWLSCLVYLFNCYTCFSILQNEVLAFNVENDFMRSFTGENMACSDMFDPNQCVFIDAAFKIIVRKFDEKMEIQKDSFEMEKAKLELQLIEIKSEI